ncbi:MAG TPA: DUF3488 and transglutaminase-like domain-containing protein [Microlunatus sp.]
MRSSDRYAIAIAVSLMLASFTLSPLTQEPSFLGVSWLLIIIIGLVGLAVRRTPLGSIGALVAQLLAITGYLYVLSAQSAEVAELRFGQRLIALLSSATEHMRTESAPMSPNAGINLLFVGSLGLIAVITDLLVITLDKPALGLAPPLTAFLVPAIGLGTDTGVRAFLCIGVGYIAILIAEGMNTNAGWARGLSRDSAGGSVPEQARAVVWRAATYIAAPALALSIVAGAALPTLALSGWGFGEGGAGGNGPLRLSDPTLDLKRNLTLPANRVVLTYRTNKTSGQYLRMASLPAFSEAGWQNTQTTIDQGNRLPQPPGLTEPTGKDRKTTIQVKNLASEYLPLPFAPRTFQASGQWGYDPNSLVVIASDRDRDRTRATQNLTYTVTSRDVNPDPDTLSGIVSGDPPDSNVTTAVPDNLPDNIRRLAERITADAGGPAEKAAAIQSFLRSSDNFTYSTDPRPGSGYQALENFLFRDKHGYCEQFAASMAIMARIVGIPSRVAVGFLPGTRNGDVWTVTARDSHAWPELYFSGYGWVRYEPTPSSVTGSAPSWSVEQVDPASEQSAPVPESQVPTTQAQPGNQGQQPSTPANSGTTTTEPTFPWRGVLGFGIGGLVLLALLASPAAIRISRRRARLGDAFADPADRIEAAWAEVRDTVRDLRRAWPQESPRNIAEQVGRHTSGSTQAALQELALLVERERYARAFSDAAAAATSAALVRSIRHGLLEDRSRRSRAVITVLPRSVFRRRSI